MEKVTQNSPETKAIRQRMEEVRCDLDEDVQEIVEGARGMGEWRSYVRTYPWVCVGASLAVGYLIVPRKVFGRPSNARALAESANQSPLRATSHLLPQGNARGTLLALVGNLVLRGVLSYAGQQANKLFATPAARSQQDDQP